MGEFVARLELACARAEDEFPKLAAPDGTVAVQFVDLRALLTLAQGIVTPSGDETRIGSVECEPMQPDAEGWSEWIHPLPGYLMQCCDCGLIHEMEFNIAAPHAGMGDAERNPGETDDGVVIFRARRFPTEAPLTTSAPAQSTQAYPHTGNIESDETDYPGSTLPSS